MFMAIWDELANLDVVAIPGFACIFGRNFFRSLTVRMLLLPGLLLFVQTCSILHGICHRKYWMPIAASVPPSKSWKMKVRRAIAVTDSLSLYSSLSLFFIYLLYPGTSQAAFSALRCNDVGLQHELLEADYALICWDSDHWVYASIGIIGIIFYAIGIPLGLGYVLYKHRATIRSNPEYIEIAHYRPLFQFFKDDCYLFECYFMVLDTLTNP